MLATDTPYRQYFDLDGTPLNAGYLYFGVADQNPEIAPITVYWDAAGTIPASQPIRTVNGYPSRSGTPAAIYAATDYSLTVRNKRREMVSYSDSSLDYDNAAQVQAAVTQLIADLASTASNSLGDAKLGVKHTATGAIARTQHDKNEDWLHVADFGATGSGSDEYTAILNALNASAARGLRVHFDGTKTYVLGSELTIPAGARLSTNGCTFSTTLTTTGDTYLITTASDVMIDELIVNIPTTKRRDRCVSVGSYNWIGKVKLTSDDQQANSAAADGALQILNTTGVRIDAIEITNWDRQLVIGGTTGTTIARYDGVSYIRGGYAYDNKDLRVLGGKVKTAAPGAAASPGHNGWLLGSNSTDGQRDVVFENFAVEDAGEHAWRVGGPEQQSKLRFINCSAFNCGGNGLKILGTDAGIPTATNRTIVIDNFVAEDVGKDASLSALNRAGLLVKFCRDVQIISPIVRKRDQTYSAQYGMVLDGVDFVNVTNPILGDMQFDAILYYATDGDVDYVTVDGGLAYAAGRYGVNWIVDSGKTMRRPKIRGLSIDSCVNKGFDIANSGTITFGLLRCETVGNNGTGTCNAVDVKIELICTGPELTTTPLSGITAADGSTVSATTYNLRKAGAWVAL